jgi:hypothetical protein
MIRQSELLHQNTKLKDENKKLKLRLKYLENYKNDVSKTFKILDNELGLINEHIKNKNTHNTPSSQTEDQNSDEQVPNHFRTTFTPNVLNSLLRTSQESSQSDTAFNSVFNRFLTGDMHFMNPISIPIPLSSRVPFRSSPQQTTQPQNTPQQTTPQQTTQQETTQQETTQQETTQQDTQQQTTEPLENNQLENSENNNQSQATVSFSVNYLPLNSGYSQYLIRREDENS